MNVWDASSLAYRRFLIYQKSDCNRSENIPAINSIMIGWHILVMYKKFKYGITIL